MGSSSTNTTKRRPRSTNTGRNKGADAPPSGASDAERGMAAPNQKQGSSRKPAPAGKRG